MPGFELKIPTFEGDEQEVQQELKAFCTQVKSAIEYLLALLDA